MVTYMYFAYDNEQHFVNSILWKSSKLLWKQELFHENLINVHEKYYRPILKWKIQRAVFIFSGTLISAFTVLCGAPTALNKKTAAFLFNLLSAFLQMITFIIIVGWVWSILWGMNMVTLASKFRFCFFSLISAHFVKKIFVSKSYLI